jgi:energy-coupling factor transporter ATP-binding protein EcfA2
MEEVTTKGDDFFLESKTDFDCVEDHVRANDKIASEVPSIVLDMPNFKENDMPFVKLKRIYISNYKIFHDYAVDFVHNDIISDFACFIGPNGCGKSTTLEIVQSIFSNYDSYDPTRLKAILGKAVRHVEGGDQSGVYGDSDFCIRATLGTTLGDYEVVLNKSGFVKDHPEKIKHLAMRLCYFTRFDQELRKFQLDRAKWPVFKELFEAVTGFTIEEDETAFAVGNSRMQKEFVFGFFVKKPNETIHYKECSDGERKIMKSFSSLLNLEYIPSIILIDNVEMHVESGRHLPLIRAMKRCFNDSQIITTTHSYHISRNFSDKHQVYDLRLLNCKEIYRQEPWRLQVFDEIKDALIKLETFDDTDEIVEDGEELMKQLEEPISDISDFRSDFKQFMFEVVCCFVEDVI